MNAQQQHVMETLVMALEIVKILLVKPVINVLMIVMIAYQEHVHL